MKKTADLPRVKSASILSPLLLLVIIMALPGVGLASQPLGSTIAISQENEHEVSPSIAYNSQRQEYLVVWYNDRAGCDDIRAQRLRWDGLKIGPPFYINAGCPQDRRYPDVVYNAAADQYLIVWEQQDTTNGYSIRARRVSGLGVLDSSDIVIRDDGSIMYTPLNPAVAYDSTAGKYLVVWEEIWHSTITSTIYGQLLTNSGALDGSRLVISEGSDARQQPDLAYNQHATSYLVVWQQKNGTEWEIRSRFVYGDGSLGTGPHDIADASTLSYTNPAVAASPLGSTDYAFFVVFEHSDTTSDMLIYGRTVNEYGQHSTSYYVVGGVLSYNSSPAVASMDSTNGSYLVVWRSENALGGSSIQGSLVIANTWTYPVYEFPGVYTRGPAVAKGWSGDFLVAWQDMPLTSQNLMGQLWGNRVFLPLIQK